MNTIQSKAMSYILLIFVFLAASILTFLYLYNHFSGQNLLLSLTFLTAPVLLQLFLLLIVYFLLDTLRFYFILKTLGINVPFPYMIKLAFINIFVSAITPFATGGGFAQIYFLTKKNIPLGEATAASTLRTLLPIVFFLITTPVLLLKNHSLDKIFPRQYILVYIAVLAVLYCLLAYFCYRLIKNDKAIKSCVFKVVLFLRSKKIISNKKAKRICLVTFREIKNFTSCVKAFLKGGRKNVILSMVYTLAYLLALFMFPVILVHAMGYNVPVLPIIETQVVITAITYLAVTPGAAGIAEGGFSLMFSDIIGGGDIVSLTLAWRFFSVYIGVIIGIVIFYTETFKVTLGKKRPRGQDT